MLSYACPPIGSPISQFLLSHALWAMFCLPYAMFAIVAIAKIQGKIFKLCILKAIYSLEYSGYMFKEQ